MGFVIFNWRKRCPPI